MHPPSTALRQVAPAFLALTALSMTSAKGEEKVTGQITSSMHGHTLTNIGVWSPDSKWLVYDIRDDGAVFNSTRIERVCVVDGKVEVLYQSPPGKACGVVTHDPVKSRIVFIDGSAPGATDWSYSFTHRRGLVVDYSTSPASIQALEALNFSPPFTPGALRGGSHVHVFDPAGEWVSFTYEDEVLASSKSPDAEPNQRNIGVSAPIRAVKVGDSHPQNRSSNYFSFIATNTVAKPKPGSDEIAKAFEEGWIGNKGYLRPDGSRQRRALAFLGLVTSKEGTQHSEVFVCDLPDDPTIAGESGPLEGTETRYPAPPAGASQKRLTFTDTRKFPGVDGPRHWLRCSPDGSRIAFLMRDEQGLARLWTVSPNGGPPSQITSRETGAVQSTFSWSPDGRWVALAMDNSVFVVEVASGIEHRLTPRSDNANAPCPEACVFSPDGSKIAYMRGGLTRNGKSTQIHVVELPKELR
jgi:hypothetical protein